MRYAALCVCLVAGLLGSACKSAFPVLYAQSLPITLHAVWDPNPVSENVTKYTLALDGAPAVDVPLTDCTATACRTAFVVGSLGTHSVSLVAVNAFGMVSDPAVASFTLAKPQAARNVKVEP